MGDLINNIVRIHLQEASLLSYDSLIDYARIGYFRVVYESPGCLKGLSVKYPNTTYSFCSRFIRLGKVCCYFKKLGQIE